MRQKSPGSLGMRSAASVPMFDVVVPSLSSVVTRPPHRIILSLTVSRLSLPSCSPPSHNTFPPSAHNTFPPTIIVCLFLWWAVFHGCQASDRAGSHSPDRRHVTPHYICSSSPSHSHSSPPTPSHAVSQASHLPAVPGDLARHAPLDTGIIS